MIYAGPAHDSPNGKLPQEPWFNQSGLIDVRN